MRGKAIAAGAIVLLFAGAAQAQPAVYTWTGMGTNVQDSAKCATYRITVELRVDGNAVRGVLKQQGRPERAFEATKDSSGGFKAKVPLAADNTLDVTGTVNEKDGRILLDGYCKFEGRLTPK